MMQEPEQVDVELFGLARQLAGCAGLRAGAGPLASILREIRDRCPALGGLLWCSESSGPAACLISLDGERFLCNPAESIQPGAKIVILPADAGG